MNLAFVVLTSALLGNHPAAASCNTCSTPAPACATCDSCGPTCGHSWRFKLNFNLFPCNTCKKADPCPAPCPAPAPAPTCCEAPKCSTCASPCSSCGHGGGFLTRFRGFFKGHGHSSCETCDTCAAPAPAAPACDGCSAPAVAPAAPAAPATGGQTTEPIKDAPKKMPVEAPKTDAPKTTPPSTTPPKTEAPKGDKATRIFDTEPAPLAIPAPAVSANPVATPSQPAVIVAPATIRNPF